MKKIIIIFLSLLFSNIAIAGCPVNELIYNTSTPIVYTFESRIGAGLDTTNDKKMHLKYWNGTAWRWWDGTDWTTNVDGSGTAILAMTAVQATNAPGEFYYNIPVAALSSAVSGKYISMRFWDTTSGGEDVVTSCVVYVQPEDRIVVADNIGINLDDTSGTLSDAEIDNITVTAGTVSDKTGYGLAADAIGASQIVAGALGGFDETYLVAGTEDGTQASTTTKVFTSLSDNTRKYVGMCLWSVTSGERSRIVGYGNTPANYFTVKGFLGAAPADASALRVYETGCQ